MRLNAKVIHIAGSKGKGSTAHLLAKILSLSGGKVGLFSSPFLFSEEEMIQINGEKIPKEEMQRLKNASQGTEFEKQTAAAFAYFNEQACDYVVLECGWGGAKDATNQVENKDLTLLTHVELEHTDVLGDSIEVITKEKLGICRPGVPLITEANQMPGVYEVMKDLGLSPILAPSAELGHHHPNSAGLALSAADALGIQVSADILTALQGMEIPGRFEIIPWLSHTLILDGAHTYDSVHFVRDQVQDYVVHHQFGAPLWAIHFLKDKRKDLDELFPRPHTVWAHLDDERAGTPPSDLNEVSVEEILKMLRGERPGQLMVFVGSFKLVAAVKKALGLGQ